MKRHGYIERRTPLSRAPFKRKPPKRLRRRAAATPYLKLVRALPCISCGSRKPSDAAHMPFGPHGAGLKSPDTNTVPLCRSCHRWFDGHTGQVLTREERRELGARWLEAMRIAVTPGDSRDEALALEAAGLGWIEELAGGAWAWRPGARAEGSAAA